MNANYSQLNPASRREIPAHPFYPAGAAAAHVTADSTATLQAQLNTLLEEIEEPLLCVLMLRIFTDLVRLLDYLHIAETAIDRGCTPYENLTFFTLVHEEALGLRYFIEKRAIRAECIDEQLRAALESMSFAIGHELRRVYDQELAGLNQTESDRMIRGRITHARGLLSNCFQQSLIILAQFFDQSLTGQQLFNDLPTRVEQSIVLRRDLWTLVQLARRAETGGDLESTISFIQYLDTFRHGSMHFLMYKDWQVYERFVDEVMATGSVTDIAPVLDRFACYLETLFAQVRMRAVLANHPFDYAEDNL